MRPSHLLAGAAVAALAVGCGSPSGDVAVPIAPTTAPSTATSTTPGSVTTAATATTSSTTSPTTTSTTTSVPAGTNTSIVAPAATAATTSTTAPVLYLRAGDEGPEVSAVQRLLVQAGYLDPGYTDGVFDSATNRAVLDFQGQYGLIVDGVVGPETRQSLRAAAASVAES